MHVCVVFEFVCCSACLCAINCPHCAHFLYGEASSKVAHFVVVCSKFRYKVVALEQFFVGLYNESCVVNDHGKLERRI